MEKTQIVDAVTNNLALKGYKLFIRTDNLLVFKSDKREINKVIFAVFCCLALTGIGLIGLVLYYFVWAQKHMVTVTMFTEGNNVRITASGNTKEAINNAIELMNIIR